MARPTTPPPAFDDLSPWGVYRPDFATAIRLGIAHKLPRLLKPLATALRRSIKHTRNSPLDLEIYGIKLRLLPRGNISEEKYYTSPKLFDIEEFSTIENNLKPGGIFVDVGANAGIYSIHAHHCMKGQGRILAVEPDPEMIRRLSFNIRTNELSDIEIIQCALSDKEGTADFFINPNQRGTNTLEADLRANNSGEQDVVRVKITTLLSILNERNIDHIDIMKIDVEGHEYAVFDHFLKSSPTTLLPRIVISETKADKRTPKLLEEAGYNVVKRTNLNVIFERR